MAKLLLIFAALLPWLAGMSWAGDAQTDSVIVILDASGSMDLRMGGAGEQKMQAAKAALIEALKQVPATTQIGLLVFSGREAVQGWAYPLGPRDDRKLIDAINRPQPWGNTPLGEYIKRGADLLLDERKKQHGYGTLRLLIVTDGEATDGNLTEIYLPEVLARGITIDVIGVDMDQAHTLATKVHSYRSANDPASLRRAVAEVFAEVAGGGRDADASDDAFKAIAGLPDKLAAGMVEALAKTGDHPIGEQPGSAQAGAGPGVSRPGAGTPFVPGDTAAVPSARSVVIDPVIIIVVVLGGLFLSIIIMIIVAVRSRRR